MKQKAAEISAAFLSGFVCTIGQCGAQHSFFTRRGAVEERGSGNSFETGETQWVFANRALTSMPYADLIVDTERLYENAHYRRSVEEQLRELRALRFHSNPCRPRREATPAH